jgi:hypothetical protein
MPAHELNQHELIDLLEASFAELVENGEVDLMTDLAPAEYEVQADEWTLHLEGWPLAFGFLALDDEPATDTERRHALDAALDSRHVAALRTLDRFLDGALAAVLTETGDALSVIFVPLLHNAAGPDLLDSLVAGPSTEDQN